MAGRIGVVCGTDISLAAAIMEECPDVPIVGTGIFYRLRFGPLPPPWRDVSKWSDPKAGTSGGGEGYYWSDFDKNGAYGSESQLRAADAALKTAHVNVIFDVVPNHMNRADTGSALRAVLSDSTAWRDGCAQCDTGEPFMAGDSDLNIGSGKVAALFKGEFENLRDNYGAGP